MAENTKTKFVGVKEFRQNMTKLALQARKKKQDIIVMKHNEPLFTVQPAVPRMWDGDKELKEELVISLLQQMKDIDEGKAKFYTHEEMMKKFAS